MIMKKTALALLLLALYGAGYAQQVSGVDFTKPVAPVAISSQATDFAPQAEKKAPKKVVPTKSDPLAVQNDIAFKQTAAKEVILPGVMRINGANAQAFDFSKTRVVEFVNGDNPTVYMSITDINRIQVPFPEANVFGVKEDLHIKQSGSNIYVQFAEGVEHPVQLYVENKNGAGATLGMQLVPKKVPAQTVLVQDNTGASNGKTAGKSDDYTTQTQYLMETVATGGSPQGFSRVRLNIPTIAMNGLVITALDRFSGADKEIYTYDVVNPTPTKIVLKEKDFDGESVLSISIYPTPILNANDHAKVVVIARKQAIKDGSQ